MQRAARFILVTLLAALPASSEAQSARQGVAPPPVERHFESPMILDLPIPDVTVLSGDSTISLVEVRNFICDQHVSLIGLALAKRYKGPRKARAMELLLTGSVLVADSYDRRVDLLAKIRDSEYEYSKQILRNHKAEEGRLTPFRIALPVEDEAGLITALESEGAPVLELTLTVRDDS